MGRHRNDDDVMTMPDFIAHLEAAGSPLATTINATYNTATQAQKAQLEEQMRPVLRKITTELRHQGQHLDTTTSRPTP